MKHSNQRLSSHLAKVQMSPELLKLAQQFAGLLHTVVKNTTIDTLRYYDRHEFHLEDVIPFVKTAYIDHVDYSTIDLCYWELVLDDEHLIDAIQSLPENQQIIAWYLFIRNERVKDVAVLLGRSEASICRSKRKIIERIRQMGGRTHE